MKLSKSIVPLFFVSSVLGSAAFAQPFGYDSTTGTCWGKGYAVEADQTTASQLASDMADQNLRGPSIDELAKNCDPQTEGAFADFDKITLSVENHQNVEMGKWVYTVISSAPCHCVAMGPNGP